MITENHQKEDLSRAFVMGISANAGYMCEIGESTGHDYGVDGTFTDVEKFDDGTYDESGFEIKFQLKASINVELHEEHVKFKLSGNDYNKLVRVRTGAPRILIVFKVPVDKNDWCDFGEEESIIKHTGWYISLKGRQEISRKSSKVIKIPRNQRLTPESIKELFQKLKSGEEL